MIDDTYMTGKISVKNHPFVEHFKFIKALEDDKEAAKKAEETGVEYTEDAAGTSLGDLLANIKLQEGSHMAGSGFGTNFRITKW